MRRPELKLIGVIAIGVLSSLIAWAFTKDWRLGLLCSIVVAVVLSFLYILPWFVTALAIHFNKSGILKVYCSQEAAEPTIRRELLPNAARIDVLTIRGLGIFALTESLLHGHLKARAQDLKVRILLLNPESEACAKRAGEIKEDLAYFKGAINTAIEAVRDLKKLPGGHIDGRLYDEWTVWRLIRIDDCILVSSFVPNQEGHKSAMYRIHRGSSLSLFASFDRHFEAVWERSRTNIV
jgi:hypothetical protein